MPKIKRLKALADQTQKGARLAAHKSGRSRLNCFFDLIRCRYLYGTEVEAYDIFGYFATRDHELRRSFLSHRYTHQIDQKYNRTGAVNLHYKSAAVRQFRPFYRRDVWIGGTQPDSDAALADFMAKHARFFAKPDGNYGGFGIERLETANFEDVQDLKYYLETHGQSLLEEGICQHEAVSRLAPGAVNTIRLVTFVQSDGRVDTLPLCLRLGDGQSIVDNASSGGMYTLLGDDGHILSRYAVRENPGFVLDWHYLFEEHPASHLKIQGYFIPFVPEAISMAKEMARIADTVGYRYLGWDIAIAANGPVLVEVNTTPCLDLQQNWETLSEPKHGLTAEVERICHCRIERKKVVFT